MTPGPWRLKGRQIRSDDGIHVGSCTVDMDDGILMSHVPEMYDMLHALYVSNKNGTLNEVTLLILVELDALFKKLAKSKFTEAI